MLTVLIRITGDNTSRMHSEQHYSAKHDEVFDLDQHSSSAPENNLELLDKVMDNRDILPAAYKGADTKVLYIRIGRKGRSIGTWPCMLAGTHQQILVTSYPKTSIPPNAVRSTYAQAYK